MLSPYADVAFDMNMSNFWELVGCVGSHTKWTCPFLKITHYRRLRCSLHNQSLWRPLCSRQYLPKKISWLDCILHVEVLYIKAYGVTWQPFTTGHFGVICVHIKKMEWSNNFLVHMEVSKCSRICDDTNPNYRRLIACPTQLCWIIVQRKSHFGTSKC